MGAEALTRALGGRWDGSYGTARCPAHSDRNPSLSIKDGDNGRLLCRCHAGCEFGNIMAALRDRGLMNSATSRASVRTRPGRDKTDRALADLTSTIWAQTKPLEGTLGERYLRTRAIAGLLPASLRFHPSLRHPSGRRLPAVVGLIEHAARDLVSLHRTYLDAETARKTCLRPDKAMLGHSMGGAVRLRDGQHGLAVTEGIETGLSLASGLDAGVAVWAALSTAGVSGLGLPPPSKFGGKLMIGADGDASGRRAAHELADRATWFGWSAEIVNAPDGRDFNDLIREANNG